MQFRAISHTFIFNVLNSQDVIHFRVELSDGKYYQLIQMLGLGYLYLYQTNLYKGVLPKNDETEINAGGANPEKDKIMNRDSYPLDVYAKKAVICSKMCLDYCDLRVAWDTKFRKMEQK